MIVERIDLDRLASVIGGAGSTTTTTFPLGSLSKQTSDYKTCIDRVQQQTAAQYPSTASAWNPFSTDTNAAPRAAATMKNMVTTCGLPQG
jgi:hypothetical protein